MNRSSHTVLEVCSCSQEGDRLIVIIQFVLVGLGLESTII
jgi:hypothetical protein